MSEYPERMVRGHDYPIAKIAAGRYCYRGRYIIRTSWEGEGPRGGTRYWWELGDVDKYGDVSLDGILPYRTMREAMSEIDTEKAKGQSAVRSS